MYVVFLSLHFSTCISSSDSFAVQVSDIAENKNKPLMPLLCWLMKIWLGLISAFIVLQERLQNGTYPAGLSGRSSSRSH